MRIAISQPRYLPALNYLHRLNHVDRFVLLDTVQRQPRGVENRNRLLLPSPSWLTVPVRSSSRALIREAAVDGEKWVQRHWAVIREYYRRCPFYDEEILNRLYRGLARELREGNRSLPSLLSTQLECTACLLGIRCPMVWASDLFAEPTWGRGPEHLLDICLRMGADEYISGPNGRAYGVLDAFRGSGVAVRFHTFFHPMYAQGNTGKFREYMAWLDAVFAVGIHVVRDWLDSDLQLEGE